LVLRTESVILLLWRFRMLNAKAVLGWAFNSARCPRI
jgi:hypothetical protein